MGVHDWTRVDAGIFHDFHTVWISNLRSALNAGVLPDTYYALAEQHAGETIADILTLHTSETGDTGSSMSFRRVPTGHEPSRPPSNGKYGTPSMPTPTARSTCGRAPSHTG